MIWNFAHQGAPGKKRNTSLFRDLSCTRRLAKTPRQHFCNFVASSETWPRGLVLSIEICHPPNPGPKKNLETWPKLERKSVVKVDWRLIDVNVAACCFLFLFFRWPVWLFLGGGGGKHGGSQGIRPGKGVATHDIARPPAAGTNGGREGPHDARAPHSLTVNAWGDFVDLNFYGATSLNNNKNMKMITRKNGRRI